MNVTLTESRLKDMAKALRADLGKRAPSYQATLDILARILGADSYEQLRPKLARSGEPENALDADALARALAPFARAFEARDELDLEPDAYDTVTAEDAPEAERVTIGDFARARERLEGTDYLTPPAKLPDAPDFTLMAHPESRAPIKVCLENCWQPDFNLLQDAALRTNDDPQVVACYHFRDGLTGQPQVHTHARGEVPLDAPVALKAEGLRTRRQRTDVRHNLSAVRLRLKLPKETPLVAFVSGGLGFAAAQRDLDALRRGRPGVRIVAFSAPDPERLEAHADKLAALRLMQDVL